MGAAPGGFTWRCSTNLNPTTATTADPSATARALTQAGQAGLRYGVDGQDDSDRDQRRPADVQVPARPLASELGQDVGGNEDGNEADGHIYQEHGSPAGGLDERAPPST